jgi:hypothetical protein
MPTIGCPGCGKKYNVPATAAGQVAKCACGKQFRLAASKAPAAATAAVTSAVSTATKQKPNSTSASPPSKSRPTAPVAKKATDDFWDDALREEQTAKVVPTAPRPAPSAATSATSSSPTQPTEAPKKKKRQSSGVRWGADWGKVGGGLLTFLIVGGITLGLVISTGRLFFWPAGIVIVGLFTALSGLMGEEGIW